MKIKERERHNTSTTLGFVDLDSAKATVLASLRSPGSRRCYEHAIAEFIDWYCSEPRLGFNKAAVTRQRMHLESRGLAPGTVNLRLAALRRLAYEAADTGLLSPERAAGVRRIKGAKKLGVREGNWLLANKARALWELPDAKTLRGKKDRAILLLLLACGLRRGEVDLILKGTHTVTRYWGTASAATPASASANNWFTFGTQNHRVLIFEPKSGAFY